MGDDYRILEEEEANDEPLVEYIRVLRGRLKRIKTLVDSFIPTRTLQEIQSKKREEERLVLIKKYGGQCEECGEKDVNVLVFHHVSYKPEKLRLLCANCHMRLHRKEGRRKRKKKGVRKIKRRLKIGNT